MPLPQQKIIPPVQQLTPPCWVYVYDLRFGCQTTILLHLREDLRVVVAGIETAYGISRIVEREPPPHEEECPYCDA